MEFSSLPKVQKKIQCEGEPPLCMPSLFPWLLYIASHCFHISPPTHKQLLMHHIQKNREPNSWPYISIQTVNIYIHTYIEMMIYMGYKGAQIQSPSYIGFGLSFTRSAHSGHKHSAIFHVVAEKQHYPSVFTWLAIQ